MRFGRLQQMGDLAAAFELSERQQEGREAAQQQHPRQITHTRAPPSHRSLLAAVYEAMGHPISLTHSGWSDGGG